MWRQFNIITGCVVKNRVKTQGHGPNFSPHSSHLELLFLKSNVAKSEIGASRAKTVTVPHLELLTGTIKASTLEPT